MLEEIRIAFDMFDENGDHTIDAKELKHIMITLGVESTNEEIIDIMKTVDKDGNGFIDLEEFIALMTEKMVLNLYYCWEE